jgi:hypothetical protein
LSSRTPGSPRRSLRPGAAAPSWGSASAGRWPLAAGRWPLAAGRWPLAAGRWPLAATERSSLTLDWSTERDLAGARLAAGVEEAPFLHLRVADPARDASFRAWRIQYVMDGDRKVSTFTGAFRMSGTVDPDNCTE